MANSDKVKQAIPIARMVKQVSNLNFSVLDQSGYFVMLNNQRILETDSLADASMMVSSMNTAISPILSNYISLYEAKIGALIA